MYANSQYSKFKLGVVPGIPSSRLSALLALQRVEEPEITITLCEVSDNELISGIREGRYDAGISFREATGSYLASQPLWSENMAVAVPLRCPLLNKAKLTVSELLEYPIFRWQAETCPSMDHRISTTLRGDHQNIQHVTSFEMMALWVAAGYGVGLSGEMRIARAHSWKIHMRPLSDGPYEIVTHLLRPTKHPDPVSERLEGRALKIAATGIA